MVFAADKLEVLGGEGNVHEAARASSPETVGVASTLDAERRTASATRENCMSVFLC